MVPNIWYRWLYTTILLIMIFGISMVMAPSAIKLFFSTLIYSDMNAIETTLGERANEYIVLVHGVLGTVMFGWGVTMLLALRGPFRKGERIGWLLIAVPLTAWYIPDTVFSIYTGFWQNAILNTLLAGLFAVPLAASRKYFGADASNNRLQATQKPRA